MNIYVGNLPGRAEESEIKEIFEQYGTIDSITLMRDSASGVCRGYGFVIMRDGWQKAVQELNGKMYKSKKMAVNTALPHPAPRGARGKA